ncbi:MAG: phosphotransferase [Myxococcota bacterium]
MDISEMRRREDFDAILVETLAAVWSREAGQPVSVVLGSATDGGQAWRFLPRHSAFVHPAAGPAVRRFLADSIRYTSRRWRRPVQFLGGTLLSTPAALKFASQPGFVVSPGVARAEERIVLPGNQRIRLFDLGMRRSRVYRKAGFDGGLMTREIQLRASGPGPFPALTAHDDEMTWFEEEVIDGWCLARCPARVDPSSAIEEVLKRLDQWTEAGAEEVDACDYFQGHVERLKVGLTTLSTRFDHDVSPWERWLDVLLERAAVGRVAIGPTHGDCQDGNVMLHRGGGGSMIDWEHYARRWVHYDRMLFALKARYQAGLPLRMKAFISGRALRWHPKVASDRAWREVGLARFLLEDCVFQVEEAATGPYKRVTEGLYDREEGLRSLGPDLADLWRA